MRHVRRTRTWHCRAAGLALGMCMACGQAQQGAAEAAAPDEQTSPDAVRQRTISIMAANTLAVAAYGKRNWWNDGFTTRFHTANEGWFGQNTYSGGADKLGHFYMNYAGVRLFSRAFEWAGNTPAGSNDLAAWLMLGTFTAIEVLDGFSKQWRFSKEDVVMNVAGIGAALMMEHHPELDRVLDLRFLYRSSREEGNNFDPFGDYSGQTYLAVVKASGIPALRSHPVLRYLELSVGYGTRGYGTLGYSTRNTYVGVSLNLSELLNASLFKSPSKRGRAQRLTDTALEFIQVPGTAALARHRLRSD